MSLPGTDLYYTHIKTKYVSGVVKSTATSTGTVVGNKKVLTAANTRLNCNAVLETADSAGTTYYIPLFTKIWN